MANIIDYINEFGTYDFEEFPFNSVDSLILSELSYFLFGKHVPSIIEKSKGVKLHSFYNKEKIIKEFIDKSLETKANAKLLEALFHSRRFGGLLINYYDSQFSVIEETQFAAMVFHLGTIDYIAFRGTDATIMGWKEDFNMAILDSIPAQSLAVEYLNKVIPHLNNDIYVGGHSKGGNLAYYGSVFCKHKYQKRIKKIFNHDGPGFQSNILNDDRFIAIKERCYKTIPQDSLIGILLYTNKEYTIVKSTSLGPLQHDPFSWQIDMKKGDFQYCDKNTFMSKVNDKAIVEWVENLTLDQKKTIINTLFNCFSKANIINVKDLLNLPFLKIGSLIGAATTIDKKDRDIVIKALWSLFKIWNKVSEEKRKENKIEKLANDIKSNVKENKKA